MSRADQCSAAELGSGSSAPGNSPAPPPRRRVRKRRYHVSRQALGRDFFQFHTIGVAEPAAPELPDASVSPVPPITPIPPATPASVVADELALEEEKRLELCRKVLWSCVVILLLIVFRHRIVVYWHEAPFAWPSINGEF
jgi:hypothetical protein